LDGNRLAGDDGRCGAERVFGGGGCAAERGDTEKVFAGGFAGGWICEVVLLVYGRPSEAVRWREVRSVWNHAARLGRRALRCCKTFVAI
jgi:hypothetical protein